MAQKAIWSLCQPRLQQRLGLAHNGRVKHDVVGGLAGALELVEVARLHSVCAHRRDAALVLEALLELAPALGNPEIANNIRTMRRLIAERELGELGQNRGVLWGDIRCLVPSGRLLSATPASAQLRRRPPQWRGLGARLRF